MHIPQRIGLALGLGLDFQFKTHHKIYFQNPKTIKPV